MAKSDENGQKKKMNKNKVKCDYILRILLLVL